MANKDHRHKKSVCEMSMLLVANIINLSSVRFAGLWSTTKHETYVPQVDTDHTTSATKLSNKSQRSQEPDSSKKPRSYLMKPQKEDPTFVRQEINDVNVSAENYINHVRRKIEKGANNTAGTTSTSSAKLKYSSSQI